MSTLLCGFPQLSCPSGQHRLGRRSSTYGGVTSGKSPAIVGEPASANRRFPVLYSFSVGKKVVDGGGPIASQLSREGAGPSSLPKKRGSTQTSPSLHGNYFLSFLYFNVSCDFTRESWLLLLLSAVSKSVKAFHGLSLKN